jgi:hypothetical protein
MGCHERREQNDSKEKRYKAPDETRLEREYDMHTSITQQISSTKGKMGRERASEGFEYDF